MTKKPRRRKSTVHPSPQPPNQNPSCLSPEESEGLAYILQHGIRTNDESYRSAAGNHAPLFWCDCYLCYYAFWRRWHDSPRHKDIHEIISADEERDGKLKSVSDRTRGGKEKKRKNDKGDGSGVVLDRSESEERVAAASSSGDESEPRGVEACSQVRKMVRTIKGLWRSWFH